MRLPRQIARTTVTVRHPVMVPDQGSVRADWDQASTDVPVAGCSWQPDAPSPDDVTHRDSQYTRGNLYMPVEAVIGPLDRVTVPGEPTDLDVVGVPQVFRDVLIPHIVARLERST